MNSKLYILSGAPESKDKDEKTIRDFVSLNGKKAVCGSTTLKIFCEATGAAAKILPESFISGNAPEYEVSGLDFASEGILTLNAVFEDLKTGSARRLSKLMLEADEIIFITGGAENKSYDEEFYKLSNVLPRGEIIDKIIRRLSQMGKTALKKRLKS